MMNSSDSFSSVQSEQTATFKEFLSYFGPGLLVSIAYLDPGNLAADIDAGYYGKYHLLWILLLSTILGYCFQVRAMMIGLVTGKDMAKMCRQNYPIKMSRILWIMAEIAIIGSDIQEVLGTAIALQILFGLQLWIGVILTIFSTVLILLVKYYGTRVLELIFAILIGTMAVCFFVELGIIKPNFVELIEGIFVPLVPSQSVSPMVGLIGSVLMPHNLYLHSSLVQEKKIDKNNTPLVKKSIFYFKIETGISLLISFFINLAVICTFANWYLSGDDLTLSEAAVVLKNGFGSACKYIWGVGLLAAGQSSTLTGTLAGQFVMSGFLKLKVSKVLRAFFTRCVAIIPSLVIVFISDSDNFNNYLNILQAIQLPFAVIPLLKLSMQRDIMGRFTISKAELYTLSILSVGIVGVNYYSSIPSSIDFSSPLTYIALVVMVLYFFFLAYVLITKIKPMSEVNQSILDSKSSQFQIQIDSNNIK